MAAWCRAVALASRHCSASSSPTTTVRLFTAARSTALASRTAAFGRCQHRGLLQHVSIAPISGCSAADAASTEAAELLAAARTQAQDGTQGALRGAAEKFARAAESFEALGDSRGAVEARLAQGLALASGGGELLPSAVAALRGALTRHCGGDAVGKRCFSAKTNDSALVLLSEEEQDAVEDAAAEVREAEARWEAASAPELLSARVSLLRALGTITKVVAADVAQQYLRASLRLLETMAGSDEDTVMRLNLEIGECLMHRVTSSSSDAKFARESALEYFDRASTLCAGRDSEFDARTRLLAATVLRGLGRLDESSERARDSAASAQASSQEQLRRISGIPNPQQVSLLHQLARHEFGALQLLALNLAMQGLHEGAVEAFRRALGTVDRMVGPRAPESHTLAAEACRQQAVQGLIGALKASGKTAEAQQLLGEEAERARATGDVRAEADSMLSAAEMMVNTASYTDEAVSRLQTAARFGRDSGNALAEAAAELMLGELYLRSNNNEEAFKVLEHALERCQGGEIGADAKDQQQEIETRILAVLAEAEIFAQKFESAKSRLHVVLKRQEDVFERSMGSSATFGSSGRDMLRTMGLMVTAYKGMGRQQEAAIFTATSMQLAQRLHAEGELNDDALGKRASPKERRPMDV